MATQRRKLISAVASAPLLLAAAAWHDNWAAHAAGPGLGVLLLHGRFADPADDFHGLTAALDSAGMAWSAPGMAWSGLRRFDVDLDEALDEIDREVARMRARDLPRVVIVGFSLGANMALCYAARRGGLDGLVMLGPGFMPEQPAFRSAVAGAIAMARGMTEAGAARQVGAFVDFGYDGYSYPLETSAGAYLSFYAPDGAAVMPTNAQRLSPAIPVLWIVGSRDMLAARDRAYAYDRLPPHVDSRYLTVDAGHLDTPLRSAAVIVDWLRSLS